MSVLPDHRIERLCGGGFPLVSPFKHQHLQPSSVDLTLSNHFMAPIYGSPDPIDLLKLVDVEYYERTQNRFLLLPGYFVLGSTVETIHVPDDLVAQVDGKSSLGRLGLTIHSTAGYVDAGFRGTITLEMFNANPRPIFLAAGLPICQISFTKLESAAERPYGHKDLQSKYQDQKGTTGSRYQSKLGFP